MKYNYNKLHFSLNIILILIVLLVYTFFFVDEELLVSLMTTVVLIGVYNLVYKMINTLFLSNINQIYQKFSLYLLMNLSIFNKLIFSFNKVSLGNGYYVIYVNIVSRVFSKLILLENLFFRGVNLVIHNFILLFLSRTSFRRYNSGLKLHHGLRHNLYLNSRTLIKSNFVVSIIKLLLN